MRKWINYSLLAMIFALIGFTYTYFIPKVESFALERLSSLSTKHSPFRVHAERLKINPFLLGVEVSDVTLSPKGELKESLGSIKVSHAFARLSVFALIRGQIRIAIVEVDSIEAQAFIKTNLNKSSEVSIPLDEIFRSPIDALEIKNFTLLGRIDPQKTVFKMDGLNLRAENQFRSLWVDIQAPIVLVKPSGPTPAVHFEGEVRGLIEKDQIRLTALKVKRDESYLLSSGFFWGDVEKASFTSSEMATKLMVELSDLKDWAKAFFPDFNFPKLSGMIEAQGTSGFKDGKPTMSFQILGEDLAYNKFIIGSVNFEGVYSDLKIQRLSGSAKNSSGRATLSDFNLSINEQYPFEIKASPNVELGQLLKNIGLNVPIHLKVNGNAHCKGVIKPEFQMNCENAEIHANDLHVYTKKEKETKTIVKLKEGHAKGSFEVNQREVKFASDLSIGQHSKGSTKGSVDYESGFTIFFKGDQVHFSDLENLADLKLEGEGSLEGETRGNADTARFHLQAKMKEFVIDDYKLGQISSDVRYEKGYLHFKDTAGLFGSSRYTGHLSINLPDSQIYIYMKSPYLDLVDVKSMIEARLPLDFPLSGSGSAEFKGSGPLDIKEMNYEVKSSIFRGGIAGETFDSLTANLRATDGVLATERVRMTKGPGEVYFAGKIIPAWTVDLNATGKNLRLEQSEYVSRLGLDIQGALSFTTKISGDIEKPIVEIAAQTRNMITGSVQVDDSEAQLLIEENTLKGKAELLGNQLITEFVLPFHESHPFSLKVKAKDLNIASIFEAVSQARHSYDFQTKMSLSADISAPTGGFWKSTGLVSIDDFLIRKGGQSLASDGPMRLVFNQGVINSENFGLSGEGNYLKMSLRSSSKENINGRLNGKFDLNLLGPFFPFANELRGLISLNTSFKGDLNDIGISGSAYLDSGYIKARDFPHPFTNLKADMLFNQKTVFFNSIQGEVADGKLSGDGQIRFENAKSIPVKMTGQIKDASFNFPEGYRTKGSIQLSLNGNQFPYRFRAQYDVTQAEIIAEFGEGDKGSEVRKSPYLPPSIAKTSEEPFYLDLTLNFLSPLTISNSIIQSAIKGDLSIQGTTQSITMNGTLVPQPGGKVFFRDVPFEILNGYIEYDSVAPNNPKLYLSALARVTETGFDEDRRQMQRQFEVNMLVQGRAQSPQVTLTSQPPLPQKDIVSLLALGLTPESLDESRATGQQMTSTSTTALGAALLQKPVGKRLKDQFGVDMKVTTSQNNADVGSSARVTLSKQWTPKLSVAASGTLEANPRSSVRLEYKVNRGLSVIGSWEGREQGNIQENRKDVTNSVLGLDLEYRVQFR